MQRLIQPFTYGRIASAMPLIGVMRGTVGQRSYACYAVIRHDVRTSHYDRLYWLGMRTCSIDGCDAKHYGRSWCYRHYMQWFRNGHTTNVHPPTERERFDARWQYDEHGCHIWTGARFNNGYGQFKLDGKTQLAHRVAWVWSRGTEPDQVHHRCGVKACVNPQHLEAVSRKDHAKRHPGRNSGNSLKTHCPAGHAYDDKNTYLDRRGHRHCRSCGRDRKRAMR